MPRRCLQRRLQRSFVKVLATTSAKIPAQARKITREIYRYHLQHLFLDGALTMKPSTRTHGLSSGRKQMRKLAVTLAVVATVASVGLSAPASAHGNNGGAIFGALLGGAVLGAVVGSAINAQPVVAYQAPVYQQPVYAAPVYAGPPPGYCYDGYSQAYVPCGPAPQVRYGYPQPGY
jgi:hypothetical protein